MSRRRRGIVLLLAGLLLVGLAMPASAQEPAKERQFVYGVNAFTGKGYAGTFYPTTVDTLYLLADTPSIVSPRYTLVYFWPITNEYKADWDGLNEAVQGSLEILQRGRVVQTLAQTQYTIQYPRGLDAGEVYLYVGAEAEARFQEFQRQRQAYRDRVWEYYQATREYQAQLEAAVEAGKQGEAVDIPEPPEEPAPLVFFSTGLHDGFPVTLLAGTYTIRVRGEDGQIVPQSERKLVVFAARREGIGYTVVPRDKWTAPEQADDPSHVIYARGGSVFYLQPFFAKEYNELYYTRLEKPQSTTGSRDRWMWVHLWPQGGGYVEVLRDGQVVERVERKPYLVKQLPGPALGYEVVEYPTDGTVARSPDFEAYEIRVQAGQPSFTIRLVEADGSVVPGSEREVRRIQAQHAWTLYLLAFLPLGMGVSLTVWRRGRLAPLPKQGAFIAEDQSN